uniref:Uncharacterized protein n=1 Tax=Bionectria ochroleuca TaxID=29856 RepID=A0A8H7TLX9_BIOOC
MATYRKLKSGEKTLPSLLPAGRQGRVSTPRSKLLHQNHQTNLGQEREKEGGHGKSQNAYLVLGLQLWSQPGQVSPEFQALSTSPVTESLLILRGISSLLPVPLPTPASPHTLSFLG